MKTTSILSVLGAVASCSALPAETVYPLYTVDAPPAADVVSIESLSVTRTPQAGAASETVPFSALGTLGGGTFVKRGPGAVVGSTAFTNFTGEVRVEAGEWHVTRPGMTGDMQDAARAPTFAVSNGAAFVVAVNRTVFPNANGANAYVFRNLKLRLAGAGPDGRGALRNDSTTALNYCFARTTLTLDADAVIGGTTAQRWDFASGGLIDLNGHGLVITNAVESATPPGTFTIDGSTVTNAGPAGIRVVNTALLLQASPKFRGGPGNVLAFGRNAALTTWKIAFGANTVTWTLRFEPDAFRMTHGGNTYETEYSGAQGYLYAPVELTAPLALSCSHAGNGIKFCGRVSGPGGFYGTGKLALALACPTNTYTGATVMNGDTTTNWISVLQLHANGALPETSAGAVLTNASCRLAADAAYHLPHLAFHLTRSPDTGYFFAGGGAGGTAAGLLKTGTRTLDWSAAVTVTGRTELAEGALALGPNAAIDDLAARPGTAILLGGHPAPLAVKTLAGATCVSNGDFTVTRAWTLAAGSTGPLAVPQGTLAFAPGVALDADDVAALAARQGEVIVIARAQTLDGRPVVSGALAEAGWRLARDAEDPNALVLYFAGWPDLLAEGSEHVANPGFESAGGGAMPANWTTSQTALWRRETDTGRNGGACLVYSNASARASSSAGQVLDWIPHAGRRYVFRGRVKTTGLTLERESSYSGAALAFRVTYVVGGKSKTTSWVSRHHVSGTTDWTETIGFSGTIPVGVTKAELLAVTDCGGNGGGRGEARFDDVTCGEWELAPVEWLSTTAYRREAEGGPVDFRARLNLETTAGAAVAFRYVDGEGRLVATPGQLLSPSNACATLNVDDFPFGTNDVSCAVTTNGVAAGAAGIDFVRLRAPSARRVRFDAAGRATVDGRPFFPCGMYFSACTESNLAHFAESEFNVIMPYSRPNAAMLDVCSARGIKVIYNMNTGFSDADGGRARLARDIAAVRTHPAVVAWYVNDERPIFEIPAMTQHQRWIEEFDPDHPTWSVQDFPYETSHYVPSYDVLGMDPYPVSANPIGNAESYVRQGLSGTLRTRPIWEVPQAFGWNWLGRDAQKNYLAPTKTQTANMAWQALASGANGVIFWTYAQVTGQHAWINNADELNWEDMKVISRELMRYESVFVSTENPVAVSGVPANVAVRAWRSAGETYLAIVNCTESAVPGVALTLGEDHARIVSCDYGAAPVLAAPNRLETDLAPAAYMMVRLEPANDPLLRRVAAGETLTISSAADLEGAVGRCRFVLETGARLVFGPGAYAAANAIRLEGDAAIEALAGATVDLSGATVELRDHALTFTGAGTVDAAEAIIHPGAGRLAAANGATLRLEGTCSWRGGVTNELVLAAGARILVPPGGFTCPWTFRNAAADAPFEIVGETADAELNLDRPILGTGGVRGRNVRLAFASTNAVPEGPLHLANARISFPKDEICRLADVRVEEGALVLPPAAHLLSLAPGLWEGSTHSSNTTKVAEMLQENYCAWSNRVVGAMEMLRQEDDWPAYDTVTWHGYVWNRSATNELWSFALGICGYSRFYYDGVYYFGTDNNGAVSRRTRKVTPGPHEILLKVNPRWYGRHGSGVVIPLWAQNMGFAIDRFGRDTTNAVNYAFPENGTIPGIDGGDGALYTRDRRGPETVDAATYVDCAFRRLSIDTLTLRPGTTLDLNAAHLRADARFSVDALTGAGTVTNGSLRIVSSWAASADEPLAVSGTLEFAADSRITLSAVPDTEHGPYVLAEASGGIQGRPQLNEPCGKWIPAVAGNTLFLLRQGTVFLLR